MRNFNIISYDAMTSAKISEENLQPCKASAYVSVHEVTSIEAAYSAHVAYLADFNATAPFLYNDEHVVICAERTDSSILANYILTTENVVEKGTYSVLPEVCFGKFDHDNYQGVMHAIVVGVAAASTPKADKKLGHVRLLVVAKNARGELVFGSVFANQEIVNTRYIQAYDFRVIKGDYRDITEEEEAGYENLVGFVTPETVKEILQILDEAAPVAEQNPLDKSFINRY